MKNIQKRTDSLPLNEGEKEAVADIMANAIKRSNRELNALRIALSQRLPQGEQKEIDPRDIC